MNPDPYMLDGVHIPQGITNETRIGSKVFLKHTSLKMNIVMNYVPDPTTPPLPVKFRCIVIKVKRGGSAQPSAEHPDMVVDQYDELFLRTSGLSSYGPGTNSSEFWPRSGVTTGTNEQFLDTTTFFRALTNKAHFRVYKDFQFTLNPPTTAMAADVHPNIPTFHCHKNLYLKLRHNKRCQFPQTGEGETQLPMNYDYRYQVFLFSSYVNHAAQDGVHEYPQNWVSTASGLTTYTDA